MTIEFQATLPAATAHHDEIVQFLFWTTASTSLLQRARAMLDAAPRELAESFEQAVRSAGIAS